MRAVRCCSVMPPTVRIARLRHIGRRTGSGRDDRLGRKAEKKFYRWHTGYPGGLKEVAAGRMLKDRPTRVVEWSVKGMLPKGSLGRRLGMKLKVYAGPDHPHQAQRPEPIQIPA